MTGERTGDFWDAVAGRRPPPPSAALLGWQALEAEPGRMKIAFLAKPEFYNHFGVIQGGFLAAMLDDTLGPAVVSLVEPGDAASTIEIQVNFLRPATAGRLIGEAKVVRKGRSLAFAEGTLSTEDGTLIATATGTWRVAPAHQDGEQNDDKQDGKEG